MSARTGRLQNISQSKAVRGTCFRYVLQEHLKIWYNKKTRAAEILPVTKVTEAEGTHTDDKGWKNFQLLGENWETRGPGKTLLTVNLQPGRN